LQKHNIEFALQYLLFHGASGSAFETQNHLIYGREVGYFESEISNKIISDYDELIHELNKLLKSLGN